MRQSATVALQGQIQTLVFSIGKVMGYSCGWIGLFTTVAMGVAIKNPGRFLILVQEIFLLKIHCYCRIL